MQSSICWIVVVLKWYLLYASSLSWYKYNSWWLNYIELIQIVQHGNFHWKTVFIAPTDVPFPSLHLGAQFFLSVIYIIIWNSLIFLWGWLIVVWMMLLQMRSVGWKWRKSRCSEWFYCSWSLPTSCQHLNFQSVKHWWPQIGHGEYIMICWQYLWLRNDAVGQAILSTFCGYFCPCDLKPCHGLVKDCLWYLPGKMTSDVTFLNNERRR